MLNLKEFEILKKESNEYYYRFTIQAKDRPMVCPNCLWDEDFEEERFIIHSTKERQVIDTPIHGKPVILILKHTRYKCPCCKKTFYQHFFSIERNCKITLRLKEYIQKQAFKKPFSRIAEDTNLSPTIVKKYFKEKVKELDKERTLIAPKVLGIDEAHLNNKMRGVFTDTENNKLIEITEDNLKRTVKETITSMKGYENIEVVTIDMWSGYKYACKEVIPQATIVVDKFHVIQYAIRALEDMRKNIKSNLDKAERKLLTNDRWVLLKNKEDLTYNEKILRDSWFNRFPNLGKAYWLKEGIRDIYDAGDRYTAFVMFHEWEKSIPDNFKAFKELQKTYNNNKQEIFNYFLEPYTNAYTESINNVIKTVEKEGKGYSYDVLRAKVLYSTRATKRPKIEDVNFIEFNKQFGHIEQRNHKRIIEGFEVDLNELKYILNEDGLNGIIREND